MIDTIVSLGIDPLSALLLGILIVEIKRMEGRIMGRIASLRERISRVEDTHIPTSD